MKQVKIYLKSGNILDFTVTNIQWTREFGRIVKIKWEQDSKTCQDELKYLDIEQIDAIILRELQTNAS